MIILVLVLVAVYVNDSWRAHEKVRQAARHSCQQAGVQFLDGSVVRRRQRLRRYGKRFVLWRQYAFEFATDGSSRHSGEISLEGRRLRQITLAVPEHGRVVCGSEYEDRSGPDRPSGSAL